METEQAEGLGRMVGFEARAVALEARTALLEARALRLESDHAYHQGALADYDAEFHSMERRLERLEEAVTKLVSAMKEEAEAKQGPLPVGERPPHY